MCVYVCGFHSNHLLNSIIYTNTTFAYMKLVFAFDTLPKSVLRASDGGNGFYANWKCVFQSFLHDYNVTYKRQII